MKKITIYVADDGMEFKTYEECADYEFNQIFNSLGDSLKFYDDARNLITNELNASTAHCILENCAYVYLGSEAAIKVVDKFGYECGCSMPKKIGYWYYDYEENIWISLTDKIIRLRKELKICETELDALGGKI